MGVPPPGEIAPGHGVGVGHLLQTVHHPCGRVPILKLPVEQPCQEEEGLGPPRGGLDRRIEGPDDRDIPGHGAENVHRLIVESDVDAGLGVHDVELDGMAVLGRIGHRQPLHPQLAPKWLEELVGRRRLPGGDGELGEHLTQLVVIRRAAEGFIQRIDRLPHLVGGSPLRPGPGVKEKGILPDPFLVMGTVDEVMLELPDGFVRLPVRLVLVGPARMPLGIPLDLPPVEEVHPDRRAQKAGQDAEKKAIIDALHGRVSSREWTTGISGNRDRRNPLAAASGAIRPFILSTQRTDFPLCVAPSPTAVSTRRHSFHEGLHFAHVAGAGADEGDDHMELEGRPVLRLHFRLAQATINPPHSPIMGIPVDSGPPDGIIANPDGNPIGIHSMA